MGRPAGNRKAGWGSPRNLDKILRDFRLRRDARQSAIPVWSTESRIDLSHSQPFLGPRSSGPCNRSQRDTSRIITSCGEYTNRKAPGFYTENDSEIIGMYLRRQLAGRKGPRVGPMAASLVDLGRFFQLSGGHATRRGFRPGSVFLQTVCYLRKTDDFAAVATEEIAFRFGPGWKTTTSWKPVRGTCDYGATDLQRKIDARDQPGDQGRFFTAGEGRRAGTGFRARAPQSRGGASGSRTSHATWQRGDTTAPG